MLCALYLPPNTMIKKFINSTLNPNSRVHVHDPWQTKILFVRIEVSA